MIPMIRFITDT